MLNHVIGSQQAGYVTALCLDRSSTFDTLIDPYETMQDSSWNECSEFDLGLESVGAQVFRHEVIQVDNMGSV